MITTCVQKALLGRLLRQLIDPLQAATLAGQPQQHQWYHSPLCQFVFAASAALSQQGVTVKHLLLLHQIQIKPSPVDSIRSRSTHIQWWWLGRAGALSNRMMISVLYACRITTLVTPLRYYQNVFIVFMMIVLIFG